MQILNNDEVNPPFGIIIAKINCICYLSYSEKLSKYAVLCHGVLIGNCVTKGSTDTLIDTALHTYFL